MNLYFGIFNRHKLISALLVSILAALFFGIADYSIALAQTAEEKEYLLYSISPTHIQVVPLVTTGLPDLTTGIAVTTTTACVDDPRPPENIILPLTGDWISIWPSENGVTACYSRFSANSSGGYDETHLGAWSYQWKVKGTDDFNGDGYDDLMLIARSDSASTQAYYQYHTVLGQPDGSFDFDTFTPQIYSPNTWWSSGIVADENGDSHADFVYWAFPTGGSHSTTLQMLAGNGDGTFSPTPQTIFRSPHGANTVSFADFDQNGHGDFYLAPDDDVDDEGQSHIALNNGSDYTIAESLDFRPNKEGPTSDTFSALATAYDVNLDGYIDLATWEGEWRGQITAEVYWGDGTGTFTPSSEMLLPAYTSGDPQKPRLAWGRLSKPTGIDLVAEKLEITQGVQDLNNSVRLVQDRKTFVRFYGRSAEGAHTTTANLIVEQGSNQITLTPLNPGGQISVQSSPGRGNQDHAFLFELPAEYRYGNITLTGILDPDATLTESDETNNSVSTNVSFEYVPDPNLVMVRIGYGDNIYPSKSHREKLEKWLKKAYPVSAFNMSHRDYYFKQDTPAEFKCGEVLTFLQVKRVTDIANGSAIIGTRYYGMVADDGGHMVGCAWIDDYIGAGPTGIGSGWGYDGSYIGHELGHSYGRHHAPFCGAKAPPGSSYPHPEGRISPVMDGDDAIYGFDLDTFEIYGPDWFDVMTYCSKLWISDFTYEALMDYFQTSPVVRAADATQNRADRLLVVGTIRPDTNDVRLEPLFVIPDALEIKEQVSGDYAITLRGGTGNELARYSFTPDIIEVSSQLNNEDHQELLGISEFVPYIEGTVRVDIEKLGAVLKTVEVGEVTSSIVVTPSTIATSNAITAGIDIPWDTGGGSRSFLVQYSPDNGGTWEVITSYITETNAVINLGNWENTDTSLFRVVASINPTIQQPSSLILIGNPDGSVINVEQGQTFKTPVAIHNIPEGTNIGPFIVDIDYDDALLKPSTCEVLDFEKFSIMCDAKFTPGTVRLSGASREVGFDNVDLVEIEWAVIGTTAISDTLRLGIQQFADNNILPLPYTTQDQDVSLEGGMIQGRQWQDSNGDGLQDADELGIKGWTISLFGPTETLTTTTDANGEYRFTGLEPGLYSADNESKPDWTQTFPTNGVHRITLSENQEVEDINFGSSPEGKGCMMYDNLQHCPKGRAELAIVNDMLVVSNIGSGDQDGVTIDLGEREYVTTTIGDIEMDGTPPVEALNIIATGTLDDVPEQPLSSVRLVGMDEGLMAISADMSALGVVSLTVTIYNSNGEQVGQSEINRVVAAMPPTFGYQIAPIRLMDGTMVAIVTMPEEAEITLDDGTVVMGSQINFEGGAIDERLGLVSQLDVLSTGFLSFGLTARAVVPAPLPETKVIIGNLDGSAMHVAEGQDIDVPVSVHDIPTSEDVHVATIKISYDPLVLEPVHCGNHPDADFDTMLCNLTFASDAIRINGASEAGVSGNVNLAVIKWKAIGSPDDSTTLEAEVSVLGNVGEPPIPHTTQAQTVNITQMGDVNCDGIISSVDALFILSFDISKFDDSDQCPPESGAIYLPACDVSGDGICDSVDALFIVRCDVGFPNSFCPGVRTLDYEDGNSTDQQNSAILRIERPEQVNIGETFTVTIKAESEIEMGAVTASVGYDEAQFEYIGCQKLTDDRFLSAGCNLVRKDGEDNRIIFNAITKVQDGASGVLPLVEVSFIHIGTAMNTDGINLKKHTFAETNGTQFDVEIRVISHWVHLPLILR